MLVAHSHTALAVSIELKDVAPDRIERQRKAAAGKIPLPGTPKIGQFKARLAANGLTAGAPIMIRIFKSESELELWMEKDGAFRHFATYPICQWSGGLGPKLAEGDKQAPEGFYTLTRRQLHRRGRWRKSLNLGFPNVYDRALARTGSYILVHGGCSSVGCYAMTDPVMAEIYDLAKAALRKGQRHIPVHAFPFRMTPENLARHANSPWHDFWQELKAGYDSFERTRKPPRINVCNGSYEVRDAPPLEVGASSPLTACGQTAAKAEAEALLWRIVNHPSRWRSLTKRDKAMLHSLKEHTPKVQLKRSRNRGKPAARTKKKARPASTPRLTCDIARPSCRRHLMLKQRRANRAGTYKRRHTTARKRLPNSS